MLLAGMASRGTPRVGMSSWCRRPTRLRPDGLAPEGRFFFNLKRRRITTYVDARRGTYVDTEVRGLRGFQASNRAEVGGPLFRARVREIAFARGFPSVERRAALRGYFGGARIPGR